tara:strand:- start:5058 stop:5378 length:321 start_codon:yes stop_codon:yes gene_type:complete
MSIVADMKRLRALMLEHGFHEDTIATYTSWGGYSLLIDIRRLTHDKLREIRDNRYTSEAFSSWDEDRAVLIHELFVSCDRTTGAFFEENRVLLEEQLGIAKLKIAR